MQPRLRDRLLELGRCEGVGRLDFYAVLDQIVELVRGCGRVSYQALKVTFELDDERFAALRAELLYARAHRRELGRLTMHLRLMISSTMFPFGTCVSKSSGECNI
jgi:hypothetical protein